MTSSPTGPLNLVAPMVTTSGTLPSRLADALRKMISDGLYEVGARLPTEEEFANHFRVGRTTVREALKRLEAEGCIAVRRGHGRFVAVTPALHQPLQRLNSVTELLARHGYEVTNEVVQVGTRGATGEEVRALGLSEEEPVVHLERIRRQDDDVLIYSLDVVPQKYLPSGYDGPWDGSLYQLLEPSGRIPVSSVTSVQAAMVPDKISKTFGLDPSEPWLLMVQRNLAADGTTVIYSHDYHRGDRFFFDVVRRVDL